MGRLLPVRFSAVNAESRRSPFRRSRADRQRPILGWKADSCRLIQRSMKHIALLVFSTLLLGACSSSQPRACEPPRTYWHRPVLGPGLQVVPNRVSLRHDGAILWNGDRVSKKRLRQLLIKSAKLNPRPPVYLEPETGVSCANLEDVRNFIDQLLQCRSGGGSCVEGYPSINLLPTGG